MPGVLRRGGLFKAFARHGERREITGQKRLLPTARCIPDLWRSTPLDLAATLPMSQDLSKNRGSLGFAKLS